MPPMTQLERLLPHYHFVERHAIDVGASAERALAAAREVTLGETPLVRLLFRLRGLPTPRGSIFDTMRAIEFDLLAADDTEVVLGGIGQPWRARGGLRRREDFGSFAKPGFAKMAFNFAADGRTLSTETRVLLTDEGSRRRFRRYWLVVRPFSGLIRRSWLRAAKRRAERPSETTGGASGGSQTSGR